jgi:outer membrane autotransporter protein
LRWLRIALLSGISLSAVMAATAHATDGTWVGGSSDWTNPANWSSNPTVPNGTAAFTNTGSTSVDNTNGVVAIGGITFTSAPNAQAYTLSIESAFIINGAGVANNSTSAQIFNIHDSLIFHNSSTANSGAGAVSYNNSGFMFFFDTSNAGNAATTITNNEILQFNDTSSAGSAHITNNAELDFFNSSTTGGDGITNNATGTITFNNSSTAASSVFTNAGTIIFSGSSTASTSVFNDSGGTITFNNSSTLGSAVINGSAGTTVTFNDTSNAGNSIINSGGAGATVTFNNSSNAGASIINAFTGGVLTFNNSSSAGSAIIVAFNNGGVFFTATSSGSLASFGIGTGGKLDISGLTSAGTTAGSISGLGNFFLGSKMLTGGGDNTSTTVGGVISDGGASGGTGGSLVKVGTGTLTLSNINTYTETTTVNAGKLEVDGSIATSSLTTVNSGATLMGIGAVGNTSIGSGGIFMPGSATPGSSMSVTGNLGFVAGSTYKVNLDPTTSSFANVSGTATLGGATVNANFAAGAYIVKQYTILGAGTVSGTFGSLVNTNLPSGFGDSLSYDGTHAYLDLALFSAPIGTNTNQQNVANALVNSFNTVGGIPAVFGSLTPAGLNQLSGEAGASFAPGAFQAGNSFLNLMLNPSFGGNFNGGGFGPIGYADEARAVPPAAASAFAKVDRKQASAFDARYGLWGAAYGGSGRIDGNATTGSNTTTSQAYGFAAGLDYRLTPDTVVGFALAGGGTHWGLDQGLGSGRSDMFQAGVYGKTRSGAAYLSGALAYSFHDVTTDRTVTIAGTDMLEAKFQANVFSERLEGGYRYATPWLGVTPYGAVQVQSIALPSYGETAISGSNQFALNYASQTVTTTRTELGARFDKTYMLDQGAIVTLYSRAAWAHDFGNTTSASAIFQALPASNFTVNGALPAPDGALVSAGAEYKLASGWSVLAKFDGEFSGTTSIYSGSGTIRKVW